MSDLYSGAHDEPMFEVVGVVYVDRDHPNVHVSEDGESFYIVADEPDPAAPAAEPLGPEWQEVGWITEE